MGGSSHFGPHRARYFGHLYTFWTGPSPWVRMSTSKQEKEFTGEMEVAEAAQYWQSWEETYGAEEIEDKYDDGHDGYDDDEHAHWDAATVEDERKYWSGEHGNA